MFNKAELKKYNAKRDAVLLDGDVEGMLNLLLEYNSDLKERPSPEVAEIMLHKCRTAVTSLPIAVRLASHWWLRNRNMESWF